MARTLSGDRSAPTLEDVARVAGVSRATVSRVVNGGNLVAPETTDAVRLAISQLGYHPNRAARALVTRRTGVIAVIVPETDERVFSDPYFPQTYHGALQAFQDSDVQVVLAMAQPGDSASRMVRYLESGHVDGAIIASHHGPELGRALADSWQPVVFIGDPEVPGIPYVDLDNSGAAEAATRHLIESGAKRIAAITGPLDMGSGRDRLKGFHAALDAAGLAPYAVVEGDYTTPGGIAAAEKLLAEEGELDGLFAANDLMAVGAIRVLQAAGLRVPDDVLVVGFDNSIAALQSTPQLTTMSNPASDLARMAAEMLIDVLAGGRPESRVKLPSRLVRRGTA